jgi:hypothetical protein
MKMSVSPSRRDDLHAAPHQGRRRSDASTMKQGALVVAGVLALSGVLHATTWIGAISNAHCTTDFKAIPGDDSACIVFVAGDQQVYKIPEQERVKALVGKTVTIVGTVTREVTIGVSYETQGILAIDVIHPIEPLPLTAQEVSTYRDWMQSLQAQVATTRKAIAGKNNAVVAGEANKLAVTLKTVAAFWRTHENAEAAQLADDAARAALATASAQTLFDQSVELQEAQNGCANCHLAHRTGKQGAFSIVK